METLQPKKIKWQGSIINRIDEHRCYTKEKQPVVGMGATEYMWSDRHAMTVTEVHKNWRGKDFDIVVVQQDHAKRKDNNGMSDCQSYEYTPNPDGKKITLKGKEYMHPDGIPVKVYHEVMWNEKTNRWNNSSYGSSIGFGHRDEHYDFTF